MLAYVFWHYPLPAADAGAYERSMSALHAGLRESGATIDSVTYRISGVPWANGGGKAYEDWYLVPGWAELGALNVSALTGPSKAPHDDAASEYAAGNGAVYELRSGQAHLRSAATAQWLAKPRTIRFPEFDAMIAPSIGSGGLWRRQMVLGPGTEFCLTGEEPAALPGPLQGNSVVREMLTV